MNNPFDFFNKIYYLNPHVNEQRRVEIEKEFKKYNISAERLSGSSLSIEENQLITSNGGILCDGIPERLPYLAAVRSVTLSHISAITLAKYQKFKNVLILEDDVTFSPFILKELNACLEDLKQREWDMFFLGCNPVEPFYKVTDNLSKPGGLYMVHAYAVNHTFYDKLLSFDFSNFWVFDQHTFGLAKDKNNKIFISNKSIANQRAGFSGAEGGYVDYNLPVQHNYKINFYES
jgi:GR25 family glycosyltransferase involved in LPS biosynthesis